MSAREADWCRELGQWWAYFNTEYLGGALRPPTLEIFDSTVDLGRWDRSRRCIGIARAHLLDDPWHRVMDTLRHEMAHQLAHEVLGATDERPHGPAFARAMERLRIEPVRAAQANEAITKRIAKLLSLAASPNEHEAQIAMSKARELLLRYNLDASQARERAFFIEQLGPLKKRHQAWEYELASILGDFFFVRCIWVPSYEPRSGRAGTRLELYGTRTNLELAAYVHDYLGRLVERLWSEYKRAQRLSSDRDRRGYLLGLLRGFHDKLTEEDLHRASGGPKALVWRGDPALNRFYHHHNPRIHRTSGASVRQSEAFLDGVAEGRAITISKPVQGGPSGEAPRLLGRGAR